MMTIYEKNGWVTYCGREEKTGEMTLKDFFTGGFLTAINEKTVFVHNFQNLVMFFVKSLLDMGYTDATKYELSYTGNHKLEANSFKYTLSRDNLAFYSLSYRVGNDTINIYEYKNLISAKISDIVKDFGGTECVAMYRAGIQIRSFAERSTTVSSCAYSYWKRPFGRGFEAVFPECSEKAEKLCRDAYHGGLCWMKDSVSGGSMTKRGLVLDVNSLYSWVMRNNRFAIGEEHYGTGQIPDEILNAKKTACYIHFMARFEIKKDHVPFVRTRCDKMHWQMEVLESSAYYEEGERYDFIPAPGEEYVDMWGEIHPDCRPIMVELCMYEEEFRLFFEQYDVYDIEYIDYVWWQTREGLFTDYVDEFYEMKKVANRDKKSAEKRIAKIMQNALSGRMSLKKQHRNSYFNEDVTDILNNYGTQEYRNKGKYTKEFMTESVIPMIDDDVVETTSKSMAHIQIGAAITSIAMCYIVRKAQENYEHFVYTDTDSLHLLCDLKDVKGCNISEELGDFKVEHYFLYARYHQLKCYSMLELKHETNGNTGLEDVIGAHVTWAGMPEDSQKVFEALLYIEFLQIFKEGNSEEDVEALCRKAMESARPDGVGDITWSMTIKGIQEHFKEKTMYKLKLPHISRVVKSYTSFEMIDKVEWYSISERCTIGFKNRTKEKEKRRRKPLTKDVKVGNHTYTLLVS